MPLKKKALLERFSLEKTLLPFLNKDRLRTLAAALVSGRAEESC